ncbi:hypothetical protein HRK28_05520 [Rathayibacter sp. VKM Ac-2835]|uniref:hypothetical protein n=1 Tax=Rathayibacter sp. VKM Ac-2835 TaxID=2739043 RepID=UPI0015657609|nr:hypothetical protein [Rathayibacter sp. VKM Ac-2835]NRG40375.1 hypothetical protein [Rathayibacter sp. VKM Ac-2835]
MNNVQWSRWDVWERPSWLTAEEERSGEWAPVIDEEGRTGSYDVRVTEDAQGHPIVTGNPRHFASAVLTDDWHTVTDEEGVAGTFHVRIGRDGRGRLVITGLVMADDAPTITRDVLRAIEPARIIETVRWWELDDENPRKSRMPRPRSSEPGDGFPLRSPEEIALSPTFVGTGAAVESVARDAPAASTRGRPGPPEADLELFRQSYLVHGRKHRWVIPTQTEMRRRGYKGSPPTRATLQRWLKRLQAEGRLPERTSTDD